MVATVGHTTPYNRRMRLGSARLPRLDDQAVAALGSVSFLLIGFLLDVATTQELVVAILYNVPIALSGLGASRRLTLYTIAGALGVNLVAGIFNAQGGVDTIAVLNRVLAALSFLLVGFMTWALRQSSARVADLQASETRAEREHLLHDLAEALGNTLKTDALLGRTAEVLRQQLRADALIITGVEGNRFSAPQYSDPPAAVFAQARIGEQATWLVALAERHDPPVAGGLEDTHELLVGVVKPQALVVLALDAKAKDSKLYLGEVLRDLSSLLERARLLENLERQRTELARRNGVIRDLVYAFSHDLRTPLIANAMNMRLALEGAYGELSHDYQNVLHNGLSANEDLLELADSLLLVARIESGENLGHPQVVDLATLLRQTRERLKPLAQEKNVQLVLTSPDEFRALGRATELRRVFQNLLDNAVKFSPPGESVQITLSRDDSDLSAQGATLSVCDSGPGVAGAVLPRLFERFSYGRAGGGSGLGLYLSKQIVAGHGGEIRYTPGETGGSCFTVWLPLAQEAVTT